VDWYPHPLAALGMLLARRVVVLFVASWAFLPGFLRILLLKSHRESFGTVKGLGPKPLFSLKVFLVAS